MTSSNALFDEPWSDHQLELVEASPRPGTTPGRSRDAQQSSASKFMSSPGSWVSSWSRSQPSGPKKPSKQPLGSLPSFHSAGPDSPLTSNYAQKKSRIMAAQSAQATPLPGAGLSKRPAAINTKNIREEIGTKDPSKFASASPTLSSTMKPTLSSTLKQSKLQSLTPTSPLTPSSSRRSLATQNAAAGVRDVMQAFAGSDPMRPEGIGDEVAPQPIDARAQILEKLKEAHEKVENQQAEIRVLRKSLDDEVRRRCCTEEMLFLERKRHNEALAEARKNAQPKFDDRWTKVAEVDLDDEETKKNTGSGMLGIGGTGNLSMVEGVFWGGGPALDAIMQEIKRAVDAVESGEVQAPPEPGADMVELPLGDAKVIEQWRDQSLRLQSHVEATRLANCDDPRGAAQDSEYRFTRVPALLRDADVMRSRFQSFCEYTLRAIVLQRAGLFNFSSFEPTPKRDPSWLDGGHPEVECATLHGGNASSLTDVLRGSLVLDSMQRLYEATKALVTSPELRTARSSIVSMRDHFVTPKDGSTVPGPVVLIIRLDGFLVELALTIPSLKSHPALTPIDWRSVTKVTDEALLMVVIQDRLRDVARLLDLRANPNGCRANLGQTCLHFAASHANVSCIKDLLKAKASILVFDDHGRLPFHHCFMKAGPAEVDRSNGGPPFMRCFTQLLGDLLKDEQCLKEIWEKASVNLLVKARHRVAELVLIAAERMLAHRTFLIASYVGAFRLLVQLYKQMDTKENAASELVNPSIRTGNSLLHVIVAGGPPDAKNSVGPFALADELCWVMQEMPAIKKSMNSLDKRGWTMMDCALNGGIAHSSGGGPEVIKVLQDQGAQHGVFWAIAHSSDASSEKVLNLLALGDQACNLRNGQGDTPLHVTVRLQNSKAGEQLLRLGADATARDYQGFAPAELPEADRNAKLKDLLKAHRKVAHEAFENVEKGQHDAVQIALSENVSLIEATNEHGYTLLDSAIEVGLTDTAEMLRKQGVKNSLFFAVNRADFNLTRKLLQNKANPFLRDSKGNTALHFAVDKSSVEICQILLLHGVGLEHQTNHQALSPSTMFCLEDHISQLDDDLLCDVKISRMLATAQELRDRENEAQIDVHQRRHQRQCQFDSFLTRAFSLGGIQALELLVTIAKSGISEAQQNLLQTRLMEKLEDDGFPDLAVILACVHLFKDSKVTHAACAALNRYANDGEAERMDPKFLPQILDCIEWAAPVLKAGLLKVVTAAITSHSQMAMHLVSRDAIERITDAVSKMMMAPEEPLSPTSPQPQSPKTPNTSRRFSQRASIRSKRTSAFGPDPSELCVAAAVNLFLALIKVTLPNPGASLAVPSSQYQREELVTGLLMSRRAPAHGDNIEARTRCLYDRAQVSVDKVLSVAALGLTVSCKAFGRDEQISDTDRSAPPVQLSETSQFMNALLNLQKQQDLPIKDGKEKCASIYEAFKAARKSNVSFRHKLYKACHDMLVKGFRKVLKSMNDDTSVEELQEVLSSAAEYQAFDSGMMSPLLDELAATQELLVRNKQKAEELAMRAEWIREAAEQAVFLVDPDKAVRLQACSRLAELNSVAGVHAQQVAALLKDSDSEVRAAATRTLGVFGEEGAKFAPELMQLLFDEDPAVQASLLDALRSMKDLGAKALAELLSSKSPSKRQVAAKLLGELDESAHPYAKRLASLLTGDDLPYDQVTDVRFNAVHSLGQMGAAGIENVDAIGKTLEDSEIVNRIEAARVLGVMGRAGVFYADRVAELLKQFENPEATKVAEECLKGLEYEGAVATADLLKDEDQRVRQSARQVLLRLGRAGALVTAEMLLDPSSNVRSDAEFSLDKMGAMGAQVVAEMLVAKDLIKDDTLDERRDASRQVLARFGQKGIQAIANFAQEADEEKCTKKKDAAEWILAQMDITQAREFCKLLLSDDPKEVAATQKALAMMGQIGAAAVAEMLKSADLKAQQAAAAALSRNTEAGAAAVADMLKDDDPEVRKKALNGLSSMGKVGASACADLLRSDDPAMRAAAAQGLGKLGEFGHEHVEAVRDLLRDGDTSVRESALGSLNDMGEAGAKTVAQWLTDPDPKAREIAATALGNFTPAASGYAEEVVDLLQDSDLGSRTAAESALGKMGSVGVKAVAGQLNSHDVEVRSYAVATLGRLGRQGVEVDGSYVVPLLTDGDPKARMAAAEALGNLGSQFGGQHATTLAALLRDPDPRVRPAAASALAQLGQPGADAIVTLLEDQDPKLREAAASVLGRMGEAGAKYAGALTLLLEDSDSSVQSVAANSLGRFGKAGVASMVQKMDEAEKPDTIAVVIHALCKMASSLTASQECKDAAADSLNSNIARCIQHQDAAVRAAGCYSVGELQKLGVLEGGGVMAFRRLAKALLADPDENVQKMAEESVKVLPS